MLYIAAPFGNYLFTRKTRSVLGTYTLEKRPGLIKQLIKTLRYKNGAWYNSLGLKNPGIDFGIRRYNKKRGQPMKENKIIQEYILKNTPKPQKDASIIEIIADEVNEV